ncbi:GIP, partial [Symbiodinium necroappetens]
WDNRGEKREAPPLPDASSGGKSSKISAATAEGEELYVLDEHLDLDFPVDEEMDAYFEDVEFEDHGESWHGRGEKDGPPDLSQEELEQVDVASQAHEVKRLVEMGVLEQVEALPPGQWQRRARLVCKQLKELMEASIIRREGQQPAAAWWSEQLTEDLKETGLLPDAACPSAFGVEGLGVMVHVDDGLLGGEEYYLEKVRTLLERKYKLQVSDVAFNVCDAVKFLKKEFVITDVGIEVKVSAHYLEKIFGILDIKRPRTRRTPCSAEITQPDESEVCDEEMAGRYRGAVGGFLYLSPDRPDCQWAIAHLARAMSRPTMKMFKHAIHLAEYMMNTRDACQVFRWTPWFFTEVRSGASALVLFL